MFLNYYNKKLSKFLILRAQAKTMIQFTLLVRHFLMMIYKFIRNGFYKLNTIIFYLKMAQFLINNMYFLFYKIFEKLPVFSYFGLLKSFSKTSYRKKIFLLKRLLYLQDNERTDNVIAFVEVIVESRRGWVRHSGGGFAPFGRHRRVGRYAQEDELQLYVAAVEEPPVGED